MSSDVKFISFKATGYKMGRRRDEGYWPMNSVIALDEVDAAVKKNGKGNHWSRSALDKAIENGNVKVVPKSEWPGEESLQEAMATPEVIKEAEKHLEPEESKLDIPSFTLDDVERRDGMTMDEYWKAATKDPKATKKRLCSKNSKHSHGNRMALFDCCINEE